MDKLEFLKIYDTVNRAVEIIGEDDTIIKIQKAGINRILTPRDLADALLMGFKSLQQAEKSSFIAPKINGFTNLGVEPTRCEICQGLLFEDCDDIQDFDEWGKTCLTCRKIFEKQLSELAQEDRRKVREQLGIPDACCRICVHTEETGGTFCEDVGEVTHPDAVCKNFKRSTKNNPMPRFTIKAFSTLPVIAKDSKGNPVHKWDEIKADIEHPFGTIEGKIGWVEYEETRGYYYAMFGDDGISIALDELHEQHSFVVTGKNVRPN